MFIWGFFTRVCDDEFGGQYAPNRHLVDLLPFTVELGYNAMKGAIYFVSS
jgi:hypothetical protein